MTKNSEANDSKGDQIEKKDIKKGNNKAFITKDKDLIRQYYELRNEIFRKEVGLTHEKWTKPDHDENSEIVVCVNGDGRVVGGTKMMISRNGELLSEEYEGTEFVYSNVMKRLKLNGDKSYAEIDDMIVDKGFRDGKFVKEMIKTCVESAKLNECSYIFYVCPLAYYKLYRSGFASCGCNNVKLLKELVWKKIPEYNYSEDYSAVVIL